MDQSARMERDGFWPGDRHSRLPFEQRRGVKRATVASAVLTGCVQETRKKGARTALSARTSSEAGNSRTWLSALQF